MTTRRFTEQRWLLDNVIRSVGMDWDQPRSLYLSGPCGVEANSDFAGIRQRISKLADASPAFEAVARRRETKAAAAEEERYPVTARDNYFMAAIHWGSAQWPIDATNAQNHFYNQRKRECYAEYASLADHHVEAARIPLPGGPSLPGWFHLPPSHRGGRVPVVISLPGMDSFKEMGVGPRSDGRTLPGRSSRSLAFLLALTLRVKFAADQRRAKTYDHPAGVWSLSQHSELRNSVHGTCRVRKTISG